MSRLPTPGSDSGTWGTILNDYLARAHDEDGDLKPGTVGTDQLQPAAITTAKLATSVQDSLSNADSANAELSGRLSDVTLSSTYGTKSQQDTNTADIADLAVNKAPLGEGVLAQDTPPADTSRIWLDTSSTVFVRSSAFVSMLVAASVPTGFSNGITVPFTFVSHDDAGYWNNTTKKFIAQSAGRYVLRCQVSWNNEDTGERWLEIWSDRNSAPRVYGSTSGRPLAGAVVDNYQAAFGPFDFAAGTSFWVVARHTATTTPLGLSTANALTWFSIEKVG